jgi:hypothetical protein
MAANFPGGGSGPSLAGAALARAFRAAAAQAGKTVVIGVVNGMPRHLNSAVQSGVATGMPAAQLFASPLRYDENWNPQPYLSRRAVPRLADAGRGRPREGARHEGHHEREAREGDEDFNILFQKAKTSGADASSGGGLDLEYRAPIESDVVHKHLRLFKIS